MEAIYTVMELSTQFSNELATARRELENANDAIDAVYAKYVEAESKSKEDYDIAYNLYELASDKKSWIEAKRDSLVIINHLLKQLEEEIENLEYAERELTSRH